MTKTLILATAAFGALLTTACSNANGNAADANAAAAADNSVAAVAPPPMITKSVPYRCKDGSVASVDYFNDNATVTVKLGDAALGTQLKADAPAPDATFKADGGWELTPASDGSITLASPGKDKQSCKS